MAAAGTAAVAGDRGGDGDGAETRMTEPTDSGTRTGAAAVAPTGDDAGTGAVDDGRASEGRSQPAKKTRHHAGGLAKLSRHERNRLKKKRRREQDG